jgi:hypothetical protein
MRRVLVIFMAAVLSACSREAEMAVPSAPAPAAADEAVSRQGGALAAKGGEEQAQPARMVIRNAEVSLVVTDARAVAEVASRLTESMGGFVTESRQWRENDAIRAHLILRVPSARLSEVMGELRKQAVRVERETVTGQDVTEEYTDLGAQLTNLEATETELRELLSTVRQRTQKAADILEVHAELTKVRGEIERIRGRMKYLSQLAAFSTINVDLVPDALAAPVVRPGWRPLAVAYDALRSLMDALQFLANTAIWLAIFGLPIGAIVVGVFLILRAMFRRLRKPRVVTPAA